MVWRSWDQRLLMVPDREAVLTLNDCSPCCRDYNQAWPAGLPYAVGLPTLYRDQQQLSVLTSTDLGSRKIALAPGHLLWRWSCNKWLACFGKLKECDNVGDRTWMRWICVSLTRSTPMGDGDRTPRPSINMEGFPDQIRVRSWWAHLRDHLCAAIDWFKTWVFVKQPLRKVTDFVSMLTLAGGARAYT